MTQLSGDVDSVEAAELTNRAADELRSFYGGRDGRGVLVDDIVESATHLREYVAHHWGTTAGELYSIDPLIVQTILISLDAAISIPRDYVRTAIEPQHPDVIARIVSTMIGVRDGKKSTRTSREEVIANYSTANRREFTDEKKRWLKTLRRKYIGYLGEKLNDSAFKADVAEALEKRWNLSSAAARSSDRHKAMIALIKYLRARPRRSPDEPLDDETWEKTWTRQKLANLDNIDHSRREFVDLGVVQQSRQFLGHNWRNTQHSNVNHIISACDRIPRGRKAVESLKRIDWYGTFQDICWSLADADLNAIGSLLARAHDGDVPREVLAAIAALRVEVASPKFKRCLLIQGSWGSGKTRLALEIAREICGRGNVGLLPLTANTVAAMTSIEDLLMSEFAGFQGAPVMPVRSMVDTLRRSPEKRLLVLVDDLHLWGADKVGQLQELISLLTSCDQVQWIITADELRMSDVLARNLRPEFWPMYGVPESSLVLAGRRATVPVIAGWVNLDEVNRRQETGFKILQTELEPEVSGELLQVSKGLEQYGSPATVLMSPLPAWTRVETHSNNTNEWVLNLSTQEFVSEYWSLSLAALVDDRNLVEEIEWLIAGVARDLITPGDYEIPMDLLAHLPSAVNSTELIGHEKARGIAALLESGGFARVRRQGDATVEKVEHYFVPEFDVVWGYRIARVLIFDSERSHSTIEDRSSYLFESLRGWGVEAAKGDWLAEAVVQYGLGTVSWSEESGATYLWWLWSSHPELPSVPLRIAAPVCPQSAEEIVVDAIRKHQGAVSESKREFFLLLRFSAKSRLSSWTALERVSSFSGLYSRINSEGFSHYFFHVLSSIFARDDLTSQEDVVGYMKALVGSEEAGFAAAAARSVTHLSVRLHNSDTPASALTIMKFLKLSLEDQKFVLFPPRPTGDDYVVSEVDAAEGVFVEGDIYCFWEHLIQQTCREVVNARGFESFFDLRTAGWFDPRAVSSEVFIRMRSEFNIAIGGHFRICRRSGTKAGKFLEILTKLMDGSALSISPLDQRLLVFYMIRHTEVTHGGYDTRVDENLRVYIRGLCEDRSVRHRLRDRLTLMATANGIDCGGTSD